MNKPFTNPWPLAGQYQPPRDARASADMPREKYSFFQAVNPKRGSIQTTINILLSKLKHELESVGITDFTKQLQYEQFVASVRLVDGRDGATTSRPSGQTDAYAVGVRITGTSLKNTDAPKQSSNNESRTIGKGKSKRSVKR